MVVEVPKSDFQTVALRACSLMVTMLEILKFPSDVAARAAQRVQTTQTLIVSGVDGNTVELRNVWDAKLEGSGMVLVSARPARLFAHACPLKDNGKEVQGVCYVCPD